MASKPTRPPLTKKRETYAAGRSTGPMFKGTPLQYPAGVSTRYVQDLTALVAQMTAQTNREITKLFKGQAAQSFFAQDAAPVGGNIASQARILVNSLENRFNALFSRKAKPMAERMVKSADAASTTALHSSLTKLTGGLSLKTSQITPALEVIYNASVAANVSLIKSIPSQYMQDVQGSVMRSITSGNGLADLVPDLEKYEGITHRRATNIALDQTRKAYNNINQGRMEAIGITSFMWHHSGGGAHPRELHIEMDGQTYDFADPPVIDEGTGETGIPGQAVNCRCTMSPIFDFAKGASDDGADS